MSDTTTRGIRIIVTPRYLPEQSAPAEGRYLFSYHIEIHNQGPVSAQLLTRHWIITNGEGRTDQVRGPGVVGCQPHLKPGQSFQYSSGCPLDTPVGTMHGSFGMRTEDGEEFEAEIRPFRLALPGVLN